MPVKGLSMEALIHGIDRQRDKQLCFLFAAVRKGDARSEADLGHLFEQVSDFGQARIFYKQAAEQDSTVAMNQLAALDRSGSGLPDKRPDLFEAKALEARSKLITDKYNALCLDPHLDRVMRLDWINKARVFPLPGYKESDIVFTDARIRHVWGRDEFDCIARLTAKRAVTDGRGNTADVSAIPLIGQFQINVFDNNNFSASLAFGGTDETIELREPNAPYYTVYANGNLLNDLKSGK